jgi:tripartite-type tricarboxylate transporter receptor subunit TctC
MDGALQEVAGLGGALINPIRRSGAGLGSSGRWNDGVGNDAHRGAMRLKMKYVLLVLLLFHTHFAQAQPASTSSGQATSTSSGQAYPTRPIRVVVPQPPGGTMDTVMRALGEPLSRQMGQQFVVDNRGGANGIIGGEIVAKAPPDGYTMLYTSNSLANNQVVMAKPPFDVLRDFVPITLVMRSGGYYVVINPQVPAQTFKELIEVSRSGKMQIHYGSGGVGNSQHLLGELINKRAGAKFMHVPYKGFAPVITAVIGAEIQLAFASPLTVLPHIKGGRLRAVAVSSGKRSPLLPELPTLSEAGMPGFVYDPAWHGMFAPAGFAPALAARMHSEVVKALASQKVRDTLDLGGQTAIGNSPAEFRRFLEGYLKEMAVLSKETGVKPL